MKLQRTKDYLLLIDEGGYATLDSYCVTDSGKVFATGVFKHGDTASNILAYYPLTPEAKELDLPLLPDSFKYEDFSALDKIVQEEKEYWYEKTGSLTSGEIVGRSASLGYKAAQAKQFSLEDIKKAMLHALAYGYALRSTALNTKEDVEENFLSTKADERIIQSLSIHNYPKQFSLEDVKDAIAFGYNTGYYHGRDKADYKRPDSGKDFEDYVRSLTASKYPKEFIPEYENGELKIVTNTEGRRVLVGGYVW